MDIHSNFDTSSVQLKRSVGLTTGCSLIIGGIIGSGIFVSPQGVLLGAGSYGLSLIIWALCGVLSMCGALTYAEMGIIIPKSGSAYYYIMEVYGDCAAFVYMFTWAFFALPSGIAIVALTCSEYLAALFFQDGCGRPTDDVIKMLATLLILFVAYVNVKSVEMSGNISVVFTVAKVGALLIIILGGIVKLGQGYTDNLDPDNSFKGTSTSVSSLAEAFLSGMWAFSGWEGLNFMIEELKDPIKTLPRSIYISLPAVTIIYLLTNIAYFTVLSPEDIAGSVAVAMTWASYVIPSVYWFVPLSVAISTFGAACGTLMLNSRLLFVAAREDHLLEILAMVHVSNYTPTPAVILFLKLLPQAGRVGPILGNLVGLIVLLFVAAREDHLLEILAMVHVSNYTPTPAVILFSILSIMYVYLGTISQLIGYTGVAAWFFHGMVGVALIVLRFTKKDVYRPYKVSIFCPIVLILFSTLLAFGPIIGNPQWGYFFAISVLLVGALLWLLLVKFNLEIPFMDVITTYLQIFAQVVPTKSQDKQEPPQSIHINTQLPYQDPKDDANSVKRNVNTPSYGSTDRTLIDTHSGSSSSICDMETRESTRL